MEPVQLAAILAAVVVLASMVSVELGIAVALFELGLGVVVGNVFGLALPGVARLRRLVRVDRAHLSRRA